MSKFKYVCISYIIVSTIFSIFMLLGGRGVFDDSYDRYLSGEYSFRARAKTTETQDANPLYYTDLDMSDTRNMLLFSSGWQVYASDPMGMYCTVYYNGNTINNFPITKLSFLSSEEADIFYGRKQYTREEYQARLESLSEEDINDGAISNKQMVPQSKKDDTVYLLAVIINVVMLVVLYVARTEDPYWFEILLIIQALLNVVYNIVIFNIEILQ